MDTILTHPNDTRYYHQLFEAVLPELDGFETKKLCTIAALLSHYNYNYLDNHKALELRIIQNKKGETKRMRIIKPEVFVEMMQDLSRSGFYAEVDYSVMGAIAHFKAFWNGYAYTSKVKVLECERFIQELGLIYKTPRYAGDSRKNSHLEMFDFVGVLCFAEHLERYLEARLKDQGRELFDVLPKHRNNFCRLLHHAVFGSSFMKWNRPDQPWYFVTSIQQLFDHLFESVESYLEEMRFFLTRVLQAFLGLVKPKDYSETHKKENEASQGQNTESNRLAPKPILKKFKNAIAEVKTKATEFFSNKQQQQT